MRSILNFFVFMVLSAGFIAIGLLIAFRPATYVRWVRWSKVESYAPWLLRGWHENYPYYPWQFRIVGIGMALFGVTTVIATVYILWFQK